LQLGGSSAGLMPKLALVTQLQAPAARPAPAKAP